MHAFTESAAASLTSRPRAVRVSTFPCRILSCRRSPCVRARRPRSSPVRRSEPRAICTPSTGASVSRATHIGARDLSPSHPSGSAQSSSASFGTASVARRLQRWGVSMVTTSEPSMARGIFPPRACTGPRVCARGLVTVRSRLRIRCWAPRSSIPTCVP